MSFSPIPWWQHLVLLSDFLKILWVGVNCVTYVLGNLLDLDLFLQPWLFLLSAMDKSQLWSRHTDPTFQCELLSANRRLTLKSSPSFVDATHPSQRVVRFLSPSLQGDPKAFCWLCGEGTQDETETKFQTHFVFSCFLKFSGVHIKNIQWCLDQQWSLESDPDKDTRNLEPLGSWFQIKTSLCLKQSVLSHGRWLCGFMSPMAILNSMVCSCLESHVIYFSDNGPDIALYSSLRGKENASVCIHSSVGQYFTQYDTWQRNQGFLCSLF